MHAVCREVVAACENASLPIMHPSMATVYRRRVVVDEIVLMPAPYDFLGLFATWLINSSTRERKVRRSGELLALW